MKPIHIILTVLYLAVLLVLAGLCSSFAAQELPVLLSVKGSPWQSRDQQNVMLVQTAQKQPDYSLEHHHLRMNWYGHNVEAEPLTAVFPKSGKGIFVVAARPSRLVKGWKYNATIDTTGGEVMDCAELRIDLIHSEQDPASQDEKFLDEHTVTSASVSCPDLWFDDMSMYSALSFDEGFYNYYQPKNEFSVLSASDIFPGVPNQLFLANIHNNEPYTGEIITQVGLYGSQEKRYQAYPSGITPIEVTIDNIKNTNLMVEAGRKMLKSLRLEAQPFHIDIDDHIITEVKKPRVRIKLADQPKQIFIDYFVGYAWIDRQVVSLSKTQGDFELNPQYHFKREPEILYARFSTSDSFSDGRSQTIAFIARKHKDKSYSEYISLQYENANTQFGAIFQDYLKISGLNNSSIVYKTYPPVNLSGKSYRGIARSIISNPQLQEPYDIFAVAPSLKETLRAIGPRHCSSFEECQNLPTVDPNRNLDEEFKIVEQYLLIRLAKQHHPTIVEFTPPPDEVAGEFEASRLSRLRWLAVALVIWLTGGILVFATIARRIRNRRQQAWFDAASRGKAKGMMPGAPIWLIVVVCVLCIGLISSICLLVSLL